MKAFKFLTAGLLALSFLFVSAAPTVAQDVRVMRGSASAPLKVPLNRAIVVESDVIFAELSVANPGIADIATLSERTIYVLGKAPGRTTLTLLGADGRLITNLEVQVTPDLAELKERLSELLPGERISVRTANDGIVLSGAVSSATRVQRAMEIANRYAPGSVLNLMVVGGTQQVQLKVRFAEMSRSVTKELGSSFSASGTTGGITTGATSSATNTSNIGRLAVSFGLGRFSIEQVIEALENKGVVRTLAEPNLTALSGKSASFLAGGEIPIPSITSDGGVTAGYRNFGVELQFTPTVVDQDIINLVLNAKVSNIDDGADAVDVGGTSLPSFKTRQTSTTVEMRDGQSFAISGLLEDDFQDSVRQIPWIGDLPILGTLFRSASFRRSQSELVVIVTAHLVEPSVSEALQQPTDRIRPPTEGELFLFGEVAQPANVDGGYSTRGGSGSVVTQDFSGSYGYVME